MEIFHQCFQYTPRIFLILLNVVLFYNLCNFFADKCLNIKLLIDISICTAYIMQNSKDSLADLIIV